MEGGRYANRTRPRPCPGRAGGAGNGIGAAGGPARTRCSATSDDVRPYGQPRRGLRNPASRGPTPGTSARARRDGRGSRLFRAASADLRFIPYKFLSDELAMPVLAYGHAYFQSLGMYFLLASLEEKLSPQSRLVIMVSPGWFDSRGLNREAFKEHVLPLLPRLLGHDEARHALLQWWNRRGNAEVARAALAELGFKLRGQAEQTLRLWRQPAMAGAEPAAPIPWRRPTADWTRLRTEAAAQETAFMASNPYGVRQDYLNKYLGNLTPDRLLAFSDNFEPATELADLERLMALLARHQAKVLFVLQPFNPLVYRDLDRFEATRLRISVLCKQYALACMDMYGVQPYALGTLRDSQHLGELGWLDVSLGLPRLSGQVV
ncbi:D-alanyl-lipoteichoic acid biosynthesis protein DltD [Bordetella hinzii]|uniref:D-alanyl-lipoteichoic acid biosynthesis protein DltD n=1 Tax=Bordetella hinzii TaxID=103855 RepID=UPI0018AF7ABC|nr:D-alanyl-lipoteichoic acid biosynthesis protein DltD [Bordetella hinzii]